LETAWELITMLNFAINLGIGSVLR